jgi:hypothetical protein
MYNFTPFDDKTLKRLNWWSQHPILIIGPALIVLALLVSVLFNFIVIVIFVGLMFLVGYLMLVHGAPYPGNAFAKINNLDKFFLKHDTDWSFMAGEYSSMKRSSFVKTEEMVWSVMSAQTELALMFTSDGGCVAWIQLDRSFPHLVVDSLADRHAFGHKLNKQTWPTEQIKLEGDFPDYFHVYQEPGQEVTTLQILSPDRMAYLVDSLKEINLEIQDNYLRLFYTRAQSSSHDFQAFLETLDTFQRGLKVGAINTIKG